MLQCLYIKLSCSASILPGLSISGLKDLLANVKVNCELAQNCPFFLQRDCLLWEDKSTEKTGVKQMCRSLLIFHTGLPNVQHL